MCVFGTCVCVHPSDVYTRMHACGAYTCMYNYCICENHENLKFEQFR